ncbi:alpha/beta hydrolase [Streptomyces griseocarneus]|nr:alpha/beta hydrolase [Streptomyces griseocarneus]
MTAFVLVPGAFTDGRIWEEVAARLRESGAEAHPVTLTGMDAREETGPGTDLETHIQDVLRTVDRLDAPDVVLVGHCYGVHPVLGAADRRPERVSRIVLVDTGLPRAGDPALALVPDPVLRDEALSRAGDGGWIAPPTTPEGWRRWGSLADLPADAAARLAERAVPQPLGTLTQPLRLSDAVHELPMTGVLCTGNGSSIGVLELVVGLGDPHLQRLTGPGSRFFELGTGHWPMLSAPGELAGILLRSAAGEGRRLTVRERPAHGGGFLLDVPERPRERVGHVDLHLPDAEGPRPAVVFVHGGPFPRETRPTPRDSATFLGYGRYAASLGVVGVTVDHRLHDLTDFGRAAEDVAAAVELVRADPRVDGERVALWFFSGGGLLSADWLASPPTWLRCVAATYPFLTPLPGWGLTGSRFDPVAAVRGAGRLPVVLSRAELERPGIAATVAEFLAAADECGADVEVVDVPGARHGFETLDHTEGTRGAVERAMRFVLERLGF